MLQVANQLPCACCKTLSLLPSASSYFHSNGAQTRNSEIASKLAGLTVSLFQHFVSQHFQARNGVSGTRLTLDEIAGISRLHSTVSRLTDEFSKRTLLSHAVSKKHGNNSQCQELHAPEKIRIMRALYIAEVFFSLFRQTSMPVAEIRQCMNNFLLNFAHWEVEQIACIHDFLFLQVSPVFNEMAAHDVFWGEFQVEPAQWFSSPELQSVLFKGLIVLESITKATTYARQQELFDRGEIPTTRYHNLYTALRDFSYEGLTMQDASVSSFETSQDYASSVKRPFFEDHNQAPFAIWKWAHLSTTLSRSVYQRNQAMLRRWGYVMWSQARLDILGILQDEWQSQLARGFQTDDPVYEVNDERWLSSWRERSRIHEQGGRGWWDFGDESQVVWPRGRKTLLKADNIPATLEEAKRAMLALKWLGPST